MTESTRTPRAPILVVEDDEIVRESIVGILEDEGLIVEAAADGQQAIDRATVVRPALVLLDMGLPRIDGYGVASYLRARYGTSVPIIVITADGRAAEKAHQVQAVTYIHKPFDIGDLVRKVHDALRSA